jgi:hypothetical protein
MADLIISSKCTLNPTGLTILGDIKFEEWEKIGSKLRYINGAVHFWIGDWLNYGEKRYGETYAQAMDETKYSYGVLRNDSWVASKIESSRRRDNLTWMHHQEVADLTPDEQDQMLDLAEKNQMNTTDFRKAVRHYKLKLDVPELSDEQLKPTDPSLFDAVQQFIDASNHAVEVLEYLDWSSVQEAPKDYLLTHLKRTTGFYVSVLQKYDKQKQIPANVV